MLKNYRNKGEIKSSSHNTTSDPYCGVYWYHTTVGIRGVITILFHPCFGSFFSIKKIPCLNLKFDNTSLLDFLAQILLKYNISTYSSTIVRGDE